MSAMELLCNSIGINPNKFTRKENLIIEATLFSRLCDELQKIFKVQFRDYFCLMHFNAETEDVVIEENFIRCILNDILSTETYTLPGVAFYTQIPEDIIHDIVIGRNRNPSLLFSRRIIELHKTVRPNLYREILTKITKEYLTAA